VRREDAGWGRVLRLLRKTRRRLQHRAVANAGICRRRGRRRGRDSRQRGRGPGRRARVCGFLGVGFFRAQFQEMGGPGVDRANPVFPAMLFITILTLSGFMIIVGWLYYAGMESSQYQGTFGKMALGLVVTDVDGRPITFARASGRFFAKIITGMVPLAIGYIMAGFTEKKQALHDMIASCLVLRKV
jgi:hypothetical protein